MGNPTPLAVRRAFREEDPMTRIGKIGVLVALVAVVGGAALAASSHREAPGITKSPKVDASDFYMFRSYEPGRSDYVTLLANYIPLQDSYGGPQRAGRRRGGGQSGD